LNIRLRTRSAAESDAVEVRVSSVEKLSGSATVTNSFPARLQDAVAMRVNKKRIDQK